MTRSSSICAPPKRASIRSSLFSRSLSSRALIANILATGGEALLVLSPRNRLNPEGALDPAGVLQKIIKQYKADTQAGRRRIRVGLPRIVMKGVFPVLACNLERLASCVLMGGQKHHGPSSQRRWAIHAEHVRQPDVTGGLAGGNAGGFSAHGPAGCNPARGGS